MNQDSQENVVPESPLQWYRGNLHTHSFWSDGHHFPEMVAQLFKDNGYHFIAFTEHDRFQTGEKWVLIGKETHSGRSLEESGFLAAYLERCGPAWVERARVDGKESVRLKPLSEYRHLLEEPGRFLILNGEEVTVRSRDGTNWVNVVNAPAPLAGVQLTGACSEAMNETVARAGQMERSSGRPILVSLNHPNYVWNATAEDIVGASALDFFEIHTALNCTFPYGDEVHPGAERLWDIVLAKRLSVPGGRPIFGIATDDCHVYHRTSPLPLHEQGSSMPCRAWVMVRSTQLLAGQLVSAMRKGDFYASSGVYLESVDADFGRVSLRIRPEPGVRYVTRFIGTRRGANLEGTPVSAPGRVTQRYSPAVGEVLAESEGVEPRYSFAGNELYVRARVTSNAPHPNPTVPGDTTKAWIEPFVP